MTNSQIGLAVAVTVVINMAVAGVCLLDMLLAGVRLEKLLIATLMSVFAVVTMCVPMGCNMILQKSRKLSWECYGELVSHGTEQDETETGEVLRLTQVKHLLVLIQNSKEGLKILDMEFSWGLVLKICSAMGSAILVIVRTADISSVF